MKILITLMMCIIWTGSSSIAQSLVNDEALRYQQQRMVYQQWDQNKFKPTSGFLGLNPYYWLTWGLFYPNYHKKDLRPLSMSGPQTQRLGLVSEMNATDNKYRAESDTLKKTALSEIAAESGLIAGADPLWLLYYSREFKPVLEHSMASILSDLSSAVSARLVSEGSYGWYKNELDRLQGRIKGAHTADMDRGSRIMAYYRLLKEYRNLSGVWALRTSSAQTTMDRTTQQQRLKSGQLSVPAWTPQTDVQIANKVLKHVQ